MSLSAASVLAVVPGWATTVWAVLVALCWPCPEDMDYVGADLSFCGLGDRWHHLVLPLAQCWWAWGRVTPTVTPHRAGWRDAAWSSATGMLVSAQRRFPTSGHPACHPGYARGGQQAGGAAVAGAG